MKLKNKKGICIEKYQEQKIPLFLVQVDRILEKNKNKKRQIIKAFFLLSSVFKNMCYLT